MRWITSTFFLAWCCIAFVSSLGAQSLTSQETDTDDALESAGSMPEVILKARPISCATLRQGQPCYVKFSMSWESNQPISACLVSEQIDAGTCWENELSGEFRKNMYLSETTQWNLQTTEGESLGQVQVRVAWVYKSSRIRRNWRLF